MKLVRRFVDLFRARQPAVLADVVREFFTEFPDAPKSETFLLLAYFLVNYSEYRFGYDDQFSVRMILSQYYSPQQIDDFFHQVMKHGDSLDDARANAKKLSDAPHAMRVWLARKILDLFSPMSVLPPPLVRDYQTICQELGLPDDFVKEHLATDTATRLRREKMLNSSAGLAVAIVVIVVFILAATFLKSLFFGFLFAYLCLPLEKFFETRFFRSKFIKYCSLAAKRIFHPFYHFKQKLSCHFSLGRKRTLQEHLAELRTHLIIKSIFLTVLSLIVCLLLILSLAGFIIIPKAVQFGHNVTGWANRNHYLNAWNASLQNVLAPTGAAEKKTTPDTSNHETKVIAPEVRVTATDVTFDKQDRLSASSNKPIDDTVPPEEHAGINQVDHASAPGSKDETDRKPVVKGNREDVWKYARHEEDSIWTMLLDRKNRRSLLNLLRSRGKAYVENDPIEFLTSFLNNSRGLLSSIFSTAGNIGTFAFDLLLCLFFFLFFLQKLAFYSVDDLKRKRTVGDSVVKGIFDSPWFPTVSSGSRKEAAAIIDRISLMFNRWLRGYGLIIVLETTLYSTVFAMLSVPYFYIMGLVAGFTILLPFLGPLLSYLLTVTVCLIFLDSVHLLVALIGVSLAYAIINGILEQFVFYPTFVGSAIGLTTLETIIVVLLGALVAGVGGMILAIPAAAVLKFLIPKIYHLWAR